MCDRKPGTIPKEKLKTCKYSLVTQIIIIVFNNIQMQHSDYEVNSLYPLIHWFFSYYKTQLLQGSLYGLMVNEPYVPD